MERKYIERDKSLLVIVVERAIFLAILPRYRPPIGRKCLIAHFRLPSMAFEPPINYVPNAMGPFVLSWEIGVLCTHNLYDNLSLTL